MNMTHEIACDKCGGYVYVETDDYMQAEMEESSDFSITFRFRQECDNHIWNSEDPDEDEVCGNVIEVVKYATIQSHFDVEQEESD
jgi:hypothetical protein